MKKIALILVLFVSTLAVNAQTILENNPATLKWNQLNTQHFRILFPDGFETQAQRMANTLQHIHDAEARSLGSRPRKISVILQNQSSLTNGFVSQLPRRSEFYSMPSQNYNFLGNNDWLDLLAAHEYRHIVQYQHALRGFNRVFYYLFGSTTFAALSQFAVPMWFWEGDAVATETAFTPAGRGRIPNFALTFKTNLLEGRTFNYDKQYLRSFKHNIPDHYVLGYHMVSYLRKRTDDPEIWSKITARTWNVPFLPFWFSSSIHRHSGSYLAPYYKEMAKDLKQQWQQEIDQLQLTPFEKVNQKKRRGYTDYLYPQVMEDGTIVALKRGIGDIERVVSIDGNEEEKLFEPGVMVETGMISSARGQVIWNEYGFHPRWRVKNYSLIKTCSEGIVKPVVGGKKERYNGAALSPDASRVATVETNTKYETSLLILRFSNGEVLKRIGTSDNVYFSMPRWSVDGKKVVVLKTKDNKKSVVSYDPETGEETILVPASEENIGYPVLLDEYLLFNSPISGIDNIYALNLKTNQRYQVTSSKYGAYNPAITKDNKTIYYNDQGRDGMDVVKAPFEPSSWKLFSQPVRDDSLVASLVKQEGRPELFDSIPQQQYPVKKYRRFPALINPYSWGAYTDNTLREVSVGVMSKNLLSTMEISAGYNFDLTERTGAWQGRMSYQGFFPIIDIQASVGNRRVDEGDIIYDKIGDDDTVTVSDNLNFKWKEQTVIAGLRLPLLLTSSRFHAGLEFANNMAYSYVSEFQNSIDGGGRLFPTNYPQYFLGNYQDNGRLVYNHFSISAYRILKQSRRDINSKFGTSVYFDWHQAFESLGKFEGSNYAIYATQYLPGIFKHHSLWGHWAFQGTSIPQLNLTTEAGLNNYIFRNQIPLPRGLSMARYQTMYSMSGNYTMPIWYPDIALGPLVNIQRLRSNLFVDYAFGTSSFGDPLNKLVRAQTNASVGVEMKLDINILRFYPKFDIGFRYSYGQEQRTSKSGQQPATGSTNTVAKFELLIGTFNF
jgi:hypothetical protein